MSQSQRLCQSQLFALDSAGISLRSCVLRSVLGLKAGVQIKYMGRNKSDIVLRFPPVDPVVMS